MDMKEVVLNQKILDGFQEYFFTISSLTAYSNAVKLVERIKAGKSARYSIKFKKKTFFSVMARLLRILISSTQLLNSLKLREYIKRELVELHAEVFKEKPEIAAQLSISIFYTILMEICYLSEISDKDILYFNLLWEKVLTVEVI